MPGCLTIVDTFRFDPLSREAERRPSADGLREYRLHRRIQSFMGCDGNGDAESGDAIGLAGSGVEKGSSNAMTNSKT